MGKDIALLLAWPETKCKQAGAWYDALMRLLSFNVNGYYTVGHAAIVLINHQDGECHYFDFGRYHAPKGFGRVRNKETDNELTLNTCISFDTNGKPLNIESLLRELEKKEACHGDGKLHVGLSYIDFNKSFERANYLQNREFIPYGPFVRKGTNCSRFVQSVALDGMSQSLERIGLKFPLMLTPTPKWNVVVTKSNLTNLTSDIQAYETETT